MKHTVALTSAWYAVVLVLLTSCGGGGSDNAAPTQEVKREVNTGTLSQTVIVLTESENSRIVQQSANQIVFAGDVNLSRGDVALASDRAFKVLSIQPTGNTTIINTSDPQLHEVFSYLRVKGVYATEAPSLRLGTQRLGRSAFSYTTATTGATRISSTMSGSLSADVDYEYDADKGGLQSSRMDLDSAISVSSDVMISESVSANAEVPVGSFSIPVPISIFDSALRSIGVNIISIKVPVALGLGVKATFASEFRLSADASGKLNASYKRDGGPVVETTFTGSATLTPKSQRTTSSEKVLHETVSVYAKLRPALAFANLSLLGIESKLSGDVDGVLETLPGPDPDSYCLTTSHSLRLSATGFLGGTGIRERQTAPIEKVLLTGDPAIHGNCKFPVTVALISASPAAPVFGTDTTLRVSVGPKTEGPLPFNNPPTGSVTISANGQECVTPLVPAFPSAGGCSLLIASLTESVQVWMAYSGDLRYAPAVVTGYLKQKKLATSVLFDTPPEVIEGEAATLRAQVIASRSVSAPLTGQVAFTEFGRGIVCVSDVKPDGSATCQLDMPEPGTLTIYAAYSGSEVYLDSASPARYTTAKPDPKATTCKPALLALENSAPASYPDLPKVCEEGGCLFIHTYCSSEEYWYDWRYYMLQPDYSQSPPGLLLWDSGWRNNVYAGDRIKGSGTHQYVLIGGGWDGGSVRIGRRIRSWISPAMEEFLK